MSWITDIWDGWFDDNKRKELDEGKRVKVKNLCYLHGLLTKAKHKKYIINYQPKIIFIEGDKN